MLFGTSLLWCHWKGLHWWPYRRGAGWLSLGWRWCYTSSWLPTKLHAKPCRRPSWSLWRHGRGLAGAGDVSHWGFVSWRSALRCSFLSWSLSFLQQWYSMLVASVCSVWSLSWLCLGGWLFGSSCTAAGCLSWEVWCPRTGSKGLAILLFCCDSGNYILSTCLDQFCWDVVNSSWPFLQ